MANPYFDYKNYFFRLVLAVLFSVACFSIADYFTIRSWNSEESLLVRIIDVGAERILPADADSSGDQPFQAVQNDVVAEVLTGESIGKILNVAITQMEGSGIVLKKDHRYILLSDVFEDGTIQYSIADTFRVPSVIGFIVFVSAALIAFAGKAGIRALLGLGLSIICLLWGFVPLVAKGYSPVPLAFATVVFISTVTVICVVNRKQSRAVALLGTLGGVTGAFVLGTLMVMLWQLSGLGSDNASLLASTLPEIDLKGVLLSSIIISAIGAVLDVGISITAAMSELVDYDPDIPLGRLWMAGIRVGEEVLGSMINTLVLAYLGTSLPIAILISNAGAEFIGLMNDAYVAQEIVQSLAGTSGLLLTIPITATLFAAREKFVTRRNLLEESEK